MATIAGILILSGIPSAVCHDRYRMIITTDLEYGIEVKCESEDHMYVMKQRHVNFELTDYTFPFDDLTPAHLAKFICTVRDEHNKEMAFT
jgi:hypothetical protein